LTSTDLSGNLRDLVVHLHRSNGPQAEAIVLEISAFLKQKLLSKSDPGSEEMLRAQQTMFAIDEVRMCLSQADYEAATTAARDAAKEWRSQGKPA
jgi:hypothetical protein